MLSVICEMRGMSRSIIIFQRMAKSFLSLSLLNKLTKTRFTQQDCPRCICARLSCNISLWLKWMPSFSWRCGSGAPISFQPPLCPALSSSQAFATCTLPTEARKQLPRWPLIQALPTKLLVFWCWVFFQSTHLCQANLCQANFVKPICVIPWLPWRWCCNWGGLVY